MSDRDTDWILAMGHALGLDSGYRVPIVPTIDAFRDLFAEVQRRAADELDRLNAQALELCAEISGLRRENERLRSDVASMRHDLAVLRGFHHEGCMAEIERLRGALLKILDRPNHTPWPTLLPWVREIVEAALAGAADQPNDATERSGIEFLHLWMRTPNPMLGNVSPLDMMDSGRGERLADFIRDAADANE